MSVVNSEPSIEDPEPDPGSAEQYGQLSSGAELEFQLRQLGGRLRTLHYRIVTCATAFNNTGAWARTGHSTCTGWLAEELGVSFGTAREWLRVGRCLNLLPSINAAFASGALSYSQVRELTRIAIYHPDRDEELCDLARSTPPRDLALRLAQWCSANEDPDDTRDRHKLATGLSCRIEPDGMGVITVRLPPLEFAMATRAIDSTMMTTKGGKNAPSGASSSLRAGKRPTLAQQRAFAFVDLLAGGGAVVNTEIIIHVRGDGTRLDNGAPIDSETVASLFQTSTIRAMIHDAESKPINVSGKHRFPTKRQKLVVDERQPVCECGSRFFLQYHHENPFNHSKRTREEELTRVCGQCHRVLHKRDE